MKKQLPYAEAIEALDGKAVYWRHAARGCRRQWTLQLARENDARAEALESAADFLRSLQQTE